MKKREYPKTVFRKKMFKGVFWTGFGLVLFLSIIAIVRVGNAGANEAKEEIPTEAQKEVVNLAAKEGGQTFAQDFASQYFNWENTDEAREKRVERLSKYLAEGLDQQAGLSYEGMEWSSTLSSLQIWKVEETKKNEALITLRVNQNLKKVIPPDKKAVEKAKKDKKKPPQPREETSGPHEKYFVVPVKTDGQSYVVHQIPYFVAAPQKPDIAADTKISEEDKVLSSELQEEVKTFLYTFFKVYTTGTQEELTYYLKDNDDSVLSMTGIMTFKEVKNLVVKEGEKEGEYIVHATVAFSDQHSKAELVYPYEMEIVKDNRWFVNELKNQ